MKSQNLSQKNSFSKSQASNIHSVKAQSQNQTNQNSRFFQNQRKVSNSEIKKISCSTNIQPRNSSGILINQHSTPLNSSFNSLSTQAKSAKSLQKHAIDQIEVNVNIKARYSTQDKKITSAHKNRLGQKSLEQSNTFYVKCQRNLDKENCSKNLNIQEDKVVVQKDQEFERTLHKQGLPKNLNFQKTITREKIGSLTQMAETSKNLQNNTTNIMKNSVHNISQKLSQISTIVSNTKQNIQKNLEYSALRSNLSQISFHDSRCVETQPSEDIDRCQRNSHKVHGQNPIEPQAYQRSSHRVQEMTQKISQIGSQQNKYIEKQITLPNEQQSCKDNSLECSENIRKKSIDNIRSYLKQNNNQNRLKGVQEILKLNMKDIQNLVIRAQFQNGAEKEQFCNLLENLDEEVSKIIMMTEQ